MSNLIEVQSVNKTYERGRETLVVLDDLSLEVPKGFSCSYGAFWFGKINPFKPCRWT